MSDWLNVAPEGAIPPGDWRVIDIEDTPVAVFNIKGSYYAIEDVCTHDGDILTGGEVEGEEIECPRHGARFNICTGAVLCAPAYESLTTFPVRVEGGMIQVRDDRWD